jgi:uncharacterized protein (TIGR03067 family)
MRLRLVVVCVCGVLLAADKAAEEVKKEQDKLKGTWAVTAIELEGDKLQADFVKQLKLEVDGDKITVKGDFPDSDRYGKLTLKIDPAVKPKIIDLRLAAEKETTLEGIYQLDGDTWRICLKLSGKERPSKFETQAGSEMVLATLKRQKP